MSVTITEGAVTLELDTDDARVIKWDVCPAFVGGVGRLAGTRAVDICADIIGHGAFYIEMKDYRGVKVPDIARAVADKVRDTFAGLTWACDRGLGTHHHESLARELLRQPLQIILWMDHDRPEAAGANALGREVKRLLRSYLRAEVIVTSTALEQATQKPLAWLRARGQPSARLAGRRR